MCVLGDNVCNRLHVNCQLVIKKFANRHFNALVTILICVVMSNTEGYTQGLPLHSAVSASVVAVQGQHDAIIISYLDTIVV